MRIEQQDISSYPHPAQLLTNTPNNLALPDEGPRELNLTLPKPNKYKAYNEEESPNTLKQYLHEIGETPLLTAKEEVQLTLQIEAAKACLPKGVPLTKTSVQKISEKRPDLLPIIQAGVEARERLVKANLRLVVANAKGYPEQGLPLLDLIEEGNLGLLKAVEKFDPTLGFRFSTYATWWIRQAISRAVSDRARIIRLPIHIAEKRSRFINAISALTQEIGAPPTARQIAAKLNENLRPNKRPYTAVKVSFLSHAFNLEPIPTSLRIRGNNEEEETELGDMIPDKDLDVERETVHASLTDDLLEQLANLSPKEQVILKLRFGLPCNGEVRYPLSLEEIGKKVGLTRERIRQIEAEALEKLRNLPTIERLKEYLE